MKRMSLVVAVVATAAFLTVGCDKPADPNAQSSADQVKQFQGEPMPEEVAKMVQESRAKAIEQAAKAREQGTPVPGN